MSPSSYPPNESAHVIRDEVAWLQGAFVSSLLCGIQITLSVMSFFAVLNQRLHYRLRITLLFYIFLLCAVMTAGQQSNLLFIQMGFIEWRNYPGGPNKFLSSRLRTPISLTSTCLFVFANWMMEALLVWRCKVVCCAGERPMWCGVVFTSTLLVSEYATSALYLSEMLLSRRSIMYALAYASLSLLLNVVVTGIIVGRLMIHRRRVLRYFGAGHGSHYATAATILIESASLYTGFLILAIVSYAARTPAWNIFQQSIAQVEAIASLLIIYRIAQGKGWKYDPGVSTGDWRGDVEAQEHLEHVVHLERVADSQATQTTGVPPFVSSKEEETPSTTDATLVQHEAV